MRPRLLTLWEEWNCHVSVCRTAVTGQTHGCGYKASLRADAGLKRIFSSRSDQQRFFSILIRAVLRSLCFSVTNPRVARVLYSPFLAAQWVPAAAAEMASQQSGTVSFYSDWRVKNKL